MRFHGTPIYYAEQIIKSGNISSTADRYDGYIKSTDMKGEISASNIDTIDRTINYFSDMTSYQRSLPAGCIFALLPRDKEDAEYGHDMMHSVDFRQNPEQLFGVFTTPENIDQVKDWMSESGFNNSFVYTFEKFIEVVKEKSNMLDKTAEGENGFELNTNKDDNIGLEVSEGGGQYLFDESDLKDIVTTRRTGKLAQLQEKIKNIIKGRGKTDKSKQRGENDNDQPTRD